LLSRIDVNYLNKDKTALLHVAAWTDNLKAAEILLAHGADPNVVGSGTQTIEVPITLADSWTPLMRVHSAEMVNLLISKGANVNLRNGGGLTALHFATFVEDAKVISQLLKTDVELNVKNIEGKTPLALAREHKNQIAINLLIAAGARE
jgi:26S proteasome non-ATPase regulatory subunit 10